jgi:hypothetical protein
MEESNKEAVAVFASIVTLVFTFAIGILFGVVAQKELSYNYGYKECLLKYVVKLEE